MVFCHGVLSLLRWQFSLCTTQYTNSKVYDTHGHWCISSSTFAQQEFYVLRSSLKLAIVVRYDMIWLWSENHECPIDQTNSIAYTCPIRLPEAKDMMEHTWHLKPDYALHRFTLFIRHMSKSTIRHHLLSMSFAKEKNVCLRHIWLLR